MACPWPTTAASDGQTNRERISSPKEQRRRREAIPAAPCLHSDARRVRQQYARPGGGDSNHDPATETFYRGKATSLPAASDPLSNVPAGAPSTNFAATSRPAPPVDKRTGASVSPQARSRPTPAATPRENTRRPRGTAGPHSTPPDSSERSRGSPQSRRR